MGEHNCFPTFEKKLTIVDGLMVPILTAWCTLNMDFLAILSPMRTGLWSTLGFTTLNSL